MGISVAQAHLRHLNPMPANLGEVLARYRRVLVPELNMGQLAMLIRARHQVDVASLNKVQGRPFSVEEVLTEIRALAPMGVPA
jgi:2-oxoglutarate ferredoxin oxidoreductase subunit alpha